MPVQIGSDKMISISEAVKDFSKLLDKSQEGPYFILRHNKPTAVVMGMKQYEAIQTQLGQLQELLDHVFLYAELQARERESGGEITLQELAAKYEL